MRRCGRFGQAQPVQVDVVMTEGERKIMENLRRKAGQAETMFANLISEMNSAMAISAAKSFDKTMELPAWAT